MKNIIKDIIFIIIFLILLHICTNVFVLKGNGYGSDIVSFYNQKKNSLDVIFFGSSHSYAAFSPDVIEEQTGLKSYNFATQQQPIYITYHYMKEALKTQKPKYFVLESWMIPIDMDYAEEGTTRDAIDKLKPSINKYQVINTSVEDDNYKWTYYFNIAKYHSRYETLELGDVYRGVLYKGLENKGFIYLSENVNEMVDNTEMLKKKDSKKIPNKNLEYLEKIIKLCKENNIDLILVLAPSELPEKLYPGFVWLKQYCEKEKIEYIDFNEMFKELKLTKGDFYDSGHLSGSGAKKVSIKLSDILIEKANLLTSKKQKNYGSLIP